MDLQKLEELEKQFCRRRDRIQERLAGRESDPTPAQLQELHQSAERDLGSTLETAQHLLQALRRASSTTKLGYLVKQGQVRESWKLRKFVLRADEGRIDYYEIQRGGMMDKLKDSIDLSDVKSVSEGKTLPPFQDVQAQVRENGHIGKLVASLVYPDPWQYAFDLEVTGRTFRLVASTMAERSSWLNEIKKSIPKGR
eukprot:Hpha_TRINITY_DN33801_c0_g1::TRINITY_DN33801_c0_g1_i1::g.27497::m.27497